MKLIIAGGRNFNDYDLLKVKVDHLLSRTTGEITIISGAARGADSLGERYAKEKGYTVERYPADWDKHGKSAGYKRNALMASVATHCICFWDGQSRGTQHMINLATEQGLPVRVIRY